MVSWLVFIYGQLKDWITYFFKAIGSWLVLFFDKVGEWITYVFQATMSLSVFIYNGAISWIWSLLLFLALLLLVLLLLYVLLQLVKLVLRDWQVFGQTLKWMVQSLAGHVASFFLAIWYVSRHMVKLAVCYVVWFFQTIWWKLKKYLCAVTCFCGNMCQSLWWASRRMWTRVIQYFRIRSKHARTTEETTTEVVRVEMTEEKFSSKGNNDT